MDLQQLPKKKLSGFGNYLSAQQSFFRAERIKDLLDALADSLETSLIPRGYGKSYGDASLNKAGAAVLMERLDRFLSFDKDTFILKAEAGASVLDVMKVFGPLGYMLPVTPGASEITLGGCVAFDVHSKNHFSVGGFGESVLSLRLIVADGTVIECSRSQNSDLFLATIGGMGLTGFILEMDIQLVPLKGAFVSSVSAPFVGIKNLVTDFKKVSEGCEYAVAWLDMLNGKTVQGHIISSNIIPSDLGIISTWAKIKPPPLKLIAPFFNTISNRIFNWAFSLKYKLYPKSVVPLRSFLFPWDGLSNWNLLYGKKGFVEYQCCVPMELADVSLTKITNFILENRNQFPGYFAAVKRMKMGTGLLTFPMDGFSLLVDFPVQENIWTFLNQLDQIVLDCGGKVYLAKDGRLADLMFAKMYLQLPRWKKIRKQADPHGKFNSDMAQRLKLKEN